MEFFLRNEESFFIALAIKGRVMAKGLIIKPKKNPFPRIGNGFDDPIKQYFLVVHKTSYFSNVFG